MKIVHQRCVEVLKHRDVVVSDGQLVRRLHEIVVIESRMPEIVAECCAHHSEFVDRLQKFATAAF